MRVTTLLFKLKVQKAMRDLPCAYLAILLKQKHGEQQEDTYHVPTSTDDHELIKNVAGVAYAGTSLILMFKITLRPRFWQAVQIL